MVTLKLKFNDPEKRALRFLAERFHQGGSFAGFDEIQDASGVDQQEAFSIIAKFENYRLVERDTSSSVTILSRVAEVVDQLDNPQPKDYWKLVETWFRGRWWSVPLVAVVVLAPIIVQWITWVWDLIQWAISIRE